ncbi:hypothetical protein JW930_00350 [Candidatus Woesearchaeota archaeon]|nr:hypothetical protein [Candidatus Woesearchaeota archaeon]
MHLKASHSIQNNKIKLKLNQVSSYVHYNIPIEELGHTNCQRITENILYLYTLANSIEKRSIHYMTKPWFEGIVNLGIEKDIPKIADELNISTGRILEDFRSREIFFNNEQKEFFNTNKEGLDDRRVSLGLSFGKDSLLSFELAKELGFRVHPVYFHDASRTEADMIEEKYKLGLLNNFAKEHGEVEIIREDIDNMYSQAGNITSQFVTTNAMLSFALEMLPVVHYNQSKYLAFGCEQNLNDKYINDDGYEAYPSYDQSSEYISKVNEQFKDLGISIMSFIEPLYNIAEYKILKKRYSSILKYMMSCSGNSEDRWCYKCPMCAKAFLYSKAVGIKPSEINFKKDMFSKKSMKLYPLFSKPRRPYEKPKEVRDEELLAMYICYKNGERGYLINKFKEELLEEAKEREDELRNKFFRIHDAETIPRKIMKPIRSIYKEELNNN